MGLALELFGRHALPFDPHERHPLAVTVAEPDFVVFLLPQPIHPVRLDLPVLPLLGTGGYLVEPAPKQGEMEYSQIGLHLLRDGFDL